MMRKSVAGIVLSMTLVASVVAYAPPSGASATPPTRYYLALGDSLSTGGGADPGLSYVDDIYSQLSSDMPGLVLKNLGCGGDSTTRMIHGGLCKDYTTGDQLGDAELFLQDHPGQVAFVTIDIGGDDIDGCGSTGAINPTCVTNALAAINVNLASILSGLRAAGGDVPIVGMTYYDPYLAAWYSGAWFHGPPSQPVAKESLPVLHNLNTELSMVYGKYNVHVANVEKPYQSNDWKVTGSYLGTALPQNVANICNWTHMCMTGGGNPNIHATDYGHSLIAAAYEKVLRVPPTISGAPPAGAVGAPYSYQYAVGGYPTVRVSKVGKLPKGLTISKEGLLSGIPTSAGMAEVTLKVRNSAGSALDSQVLVIS